MKINTMPDVTALSERQCPKTIEELEDVIRKSGNVEASPPFEWLAEAIRLTDGFLERTLMFLRQEVVRAQETLPDIPLIKKPGSLTLTQRQYLCIHANAFFCTFTNRLSNNCLSGPDIPSINFDELYGGYGWGTVEVAKLRMLFNYFERCRQRQISGDSLARPVHTIRHKAEASTAESWEQCSRALIMPVIYPLKKSIDEAKGMLQVDFANRIIGGAAIAYGCVQEEIMFCVCPELIVSRLFCPAMKSDEAIVIIGAEQFSKPSGYAASLDYGGDYIDSTPLQEDGALASYVSAIDALDFRSCDVKRQYSQEIILRELNKALAGFDVEGTPNRVATGNWGCGAFGGDAELKSVIQWMAAIRTGKVMHYFPWDNEEVLSGLPNLATDLVARDVTVDESAKFLLHSLKPERVYAQLQRYFV